MSAPRYMKMETYEAAETLDIFGYPDYGLELELIIEQQEKTNTQLEQSIEYLAYLPQIYNVVALVLGLLVAIVVWRLLTSFIGRVFNDNSKL